MAASNPSKIKTFFSLHEFFYNFHRGWNFSKICFFEFLRIVWGFLWCLTMWTCVKLSLLQYWLWVLCSYFYLVIKAFLRSANYFFGIYAYVWWRIRSTSNGEEGWGEGGGRRSPLPFFENWKNCPNNGGKWFDCVHP